MKEHPETVNAPIISTAIQSILLNQFTNELKFGAPDWYDGTDSNYEGVAKAKLEHLTAEAKEKRATFTDYLLAQAFECATRTESYELRPALCSLGATVVQWIESLDRRYGGGA